MEVHNSLPSMFVHGVCQQFFFRLSFPKLPTKFLRKNRYTVATVRIGIPFCRQELEGLTKVVALLDSDDGELSSSCPLTRLVKYLRKLTGVEDVLPIPLVRLVSKTLARLRMLPLRTWEEFVHPSKIFLEKLVDDFLHQAGLSPDGAMSTAQNAFRKVSGSARFSAFLALLDLGTTTMNPTMDYDVERSGATPFAALLKAYKQKLNASFFEGDNFFWTEATLDAMLHLEARTQTKLPAILCGRAGTGKHTLLRFWAEIGNREYRSYVLNEDNDEVSFAAFLRDLESAYGDAPVDIVLGIEGTRADAVRELVVCKKIAGRKVLGFFPGLTLVGIVEEESPTQNEIAARGKKSTLEEDHSNSGTTTAAEDARDHSSSATESGVGLSRLTSFGTANSGQGRLTRTGTVNSNGETLVPSLPAGGTTTNPSLQCSLQGCLRTKTTSQNYSLFDLRMSPSAHGMLAASLVQSLLPTRPGQSLARMFKAKNCTLTEAKTAVGLYKVLEHNLAEEEAIATVLCLVQGGTGLLPRDGVSSNNQLLGGHDLYCWGGSEAEGDLSSEQRELLWDRFKNSQREILSGEENQTVKDALEATINTPAADALFEGLCAIVVGAAAAAIPTIVVVASEIVSASQTGSLSEKLLSEKPLGSSVSCSSPGGTRGGTPIPTTVFRFRVTGHQLCLEDELNLLHSKIGAYIGTGTGWLIGNGDRCQTGVRPVSCRMHSPCHSELS